MRDKIRYGFIIAGIYNSFIILFSLGFSENLGIIDPLFSSSGCIGILLWGAAYFALAQRYQEAPSVAAVFCLEKGFYAAHWGLWMNQNINDLASIFASDMLAGLFYAIYGAGDAMFMVFFGWVAWTYRHNAFGPLTGSFQKVD
jgi:hypothetical protein